jgi:hypothetical protein
MPAPCTGRLYFTDRVARFVQAATALLGTSALISLAALLPMSLNPTGSEETDPAALGSVLHACPDRLERGGGGPYHAPAHPRHLRHLHGRHRLLARALGHRVTGSDANVYPPMSTQLEAAGIDLMEGYDPAHLSPPRTWWWWAMR